MSLLTEREDLVSANLTKPIIKGINWCFTQAKNRHPDNSVNMALIKSPDLSAALFGFVFIFSQVGGVQLVLELFELGIRRMAQ